MKIDGLPVKNGDFPVRYVKFSMCYGIVQADPMGYRIALHYLQSWFFCDLLVAIPFDLLGAPGDPWGTVAWKICERRTGKYRWVCMSMFIYVYLKNEG